MSCLHRHASHCFASVVLLGAAFVAASGGCSAGASNTGTTAATTAGTTAGSGGAGGGAGGTDASVASTVASTVASSVSSSSASSSSTGAGGAAAVCGNNVVEAGEACDGSDFGGKTCVDFGLAGGNLICNAFCTIVVSDCTPAETCGNGNDDDQDGDTDCADSDCSNEPNCKDSCVGPIVIADGGFDFTDTTGRPDTLSSSCAPDSGPEVVYTYTAPLDVDVVVSMGFSDPDVSLSVRTACGNAASEIVCANQGGSFDSESVGFKAKKGTQYFIIVDGTGPFEYGSVSIQLEEVLPESSCSDYVDNDQDGLVDCADTTNCNVSADCKPGVGKTAATCTAHSDCAATGNDPLCIDEMNYGWPGGYCSEYCDVLKNDCPAGSVCADPAALGAPFGKSGLGVCFKICTKKADCAADYMCSDFGAGFVCKH